MTKGIALVPGYWYVLKGTDTPHTLKPYRYVGYGPNSDHLFVSVDPEHEPPEEEGYDWQETERAAWDGTEARERDVLCRWKDWPDYSAKRDKRRAAAAKAKVTRKQTLASKKEAETKRRQEEWKASRPALEKRLHEKPGVISASWLGMRIQGQERAALSVGVEGRENVERVLALFGETLSDEDFQEISEGGDQ